jgi:hypothetical protein
MTPDARHSSRLADAETPEAIEAAWAHNRWPTIGLHTGAGVGLLMGIAFLSGWLLTIAFIVGLAVTGCVVGLGLAGIMFRRAGRSSSRSLGGELEKAAEDHRGDTAQQDGSRGEDRAGRIAGSEPEAHDHGEQA